jgi:hypothetical protein
MSVIFDSGSLFGTLYTCVTMACDGLMSLFTTASEPSREQEVHGSNKAVFGNREIMLPTTIYDNRCFVRLKQKRSSDSDHGFPTTQLVAYDSWSFTHRECETHLFIPSVLAFPRHHNHTALFLPCSSFPLPLRCPTAMQRKEATDQAKISSRDQITQALLLTAARSPSMAARHFGAGGSAARVAKQGVRRTSACP